MKEILLQHFLKTNLCRQTNGHYKNNYHFTANIQYIGQPMLPGIKSLELENSIKAKLYCIKL